MVPKSGSEAQTFLYFNLCTLVKLEGSSYQLKGFVKRGVFSKPNREAFEHVMHFLINAYDPQLRRSIITSWPIIDRKTEERVFRRQVVVAVEKISSLETDFGLPAFSNSFLSTPGGERLEKFLYKLSCLSLRAVLQRSGRPNVFSPPRGFHPRRCLTIAESRMHANMKDVMKNIQRSISLIRFCLTEAAILNDKLVSNQRAIKAARSSINESVSVEEFFNTEIEAELRKRLQTLLQSLQVIQNQEKLIGNCENVARVVLDVHQVTAGLDCEENLDIANLLSRTAGAVESISTRFGRPTNPEVYPKLMAAGEELSKISQLMDKNLKSVLELAATTTASTQPAGSVNGNMGTPERFRHACQLLEDASYATPPLEFRPASSNPSWQTISSDTESPPISSVADLLCTQKTNGTNGATHRLFRNMVNGRRPLLGALPQTSQNGSTKTFSCTPARPRSEIPIKVASKSSKSLVENPNETVQKVPATHRVLPNVVPSEGLSTLAHSMVSNKKVDDLLSNSEPNKENSAQDVLNLVVSVLNPNPTGNATGKEEVVIEEPIEKPKPEKQFASLEFSESMSDSPVKETESEKAAPEKNPTLRRKSILDLIERYKGVVPASDSVPVHAVNIAEETGPDEWKDSDVDVSLDSDDDVIVNKDSVQFFTLSPGF